MDNQRFWNSNWFRLVVGTTISLVFLYLALKDVPLGDVVESLARANYAWVALAVAITILGSYLRALRWIRLYYPMDKDLRAWQMWGISLIGQMLNIIFPWRVGELARIALAGEIEKRSKTQTLATLGIEKIFDTLMLLAILLSIPLFIALPDWLEESRSGLAITSVILLSAAVVLLISRRWLLVIVQKIPGLRENVFEHLQLALKSLDVVKRWDLHVALQALSIAVWFLGGLTNYLVLIALNLPLAFISAFVLLAVLQVGGLVPGAPGRVGVFQYLCILTLALFGVDKGVGLTYGILLYIVAYAPPLILGVFFLWWDGINLRRISAETAL
jgi:glycosyltransferase 2 family protein